MKIKRSFLLVVGFLVVGGALLLSYSKLWRTKAQEPPPNLLILTPTYQFNVLKNPTGVTVVRDAQGIGHLYIADSGNHVIRHFRLGLGGTLQIAAGSTEGYVNGSNLSAKFDYPSGLAGTNYVIPTQPQGFLQYTNCQEIYVNDTQNFVVRKFKVNVGPYGDSYGACAATTQTAAGNHSAGMVDGPGTSASFRQVAGMEKTSSGYCYMADAGNHAVRGWDGSNVTTLAGSGSPGFVDGNGSAAQFMVPTKVTKASSGYLYVADVGNNAIRMIDSWNNVTTCAGAGPTEAGYVNGQGTQAKFYRPTSIVYNATDSMLYIADSHNNVIRKMDSYGNVTTYAGTGTPGLVNGSLSQAQFDKPTDIAIFNGVMYVADSMNNVIRRIDMVNGTVTTYIS
jgi:hypothetical protein